MSCASFIASLCIISLSFSSIALAADAPQVTVLPEVEVTGSNTSLISPDIETAAARLSQMPVAASTVSSDHFQTSRGSYLEDFIPYTAGVYIQSGQGSDDTHVSIRGSGLQSDDLTGLEILLDGMNINQGDGEAFHAGYRLAGCEIRNEVYRGADAAALGAGSHPGRSDQPGHDDGIRCAAWLQLSSSRAGGSSYDF